MADNNNNNTKKNPVSNNQVSEGFFSRGEGTLKVPMTLFGTNRSNLAERMLKEVLKSNKKDRPHIALLQGGLQTTRYDTDHENLFRQESFFHYLFGVEEPDCFGLIDFSSGEAKPILFFPNLPEAYEVWLGFRRPLTFFEEKYGVPCRYVEDLAEVIREMQPETIYTLKGKNTDSGEWAKPAQFAGIEKYNVNEEDLFWQIVECRTIKTPEEVEVLRYVNRMASEAHQEVMRHLWANKYEYQMEALFQFYCYYTGGCRVAPYTCICGSGENGAILHYGHAAEPNSKKALQGDMLLLDMGTEYCCYGSDITRSYPVSGHFDERQRTIYSVVFAAQNAVIEACKPEVHYRDLHLLALKTTLEKLKEFGFLKGEIADMMQDHIGPLFMPHGLGHMIGIDTHDVGGYAKGTGKEVDNPSLKSLRLSRVLKPGMCLTLEPGCYFNKAILLKAFNDPAKSKYLNIEKINQYIDFGGVRIEDDFVVTETGCENLTTAPRTLEEIERYMKNPIQRPIFN